MYAVIETGGKQYRVTPGEQVDVERLDHPVGGRVEFDRVLMVRTDQGMVIGHPVVEEAKVVGEVLACDRGERVTVFKKKRRKNYKRTRGHRQWFTRVKVVEIQSS
jgi:large subunit ribosomal protein L21